MTEYNDSGFNIIRYLEFLREKKYFDCSEMLVEFVKSQRYIYTTKDDIKSEVWIYKEGIYVPEGKSEIKEILRWILGKFYSEKSYKDTMIKIEADTFIDADEFFKDKYPHEIILLNGIFNLTTKTLSPYTHEKIFFNKFNVNYNPSAKCPQIDKFLSEVLAYEEDKKVFYEIAGFGLLKDYTYEKAFMLVGDGRNGKSKSIQLLKTVYGIENCSAIPLSSLDANSFSISELYGKHLNIAGDIGNQDLKDTSLFKGLTGRDTISAKRKYLRDIKFTNFAKFIFACNDLPMVYDTSKGFWDRWTLLEYPYTFVSKEEYDSSEDKSNLKIKNDRIIEEITTPEELSGFFNEIVKALDRLILQNKFSSSKGTKDVKLCWIKKSNSFASFCEEWIEPSTHEVSKKELRKRYSEYCKEHNVRNKSDKVIAIYLQENYGVFDSQNSNFDRVWEGIQFKNPIKDERLSSNEPIKK
jgi:putative DNA primase/helicase